MARDPRDGPVVDTRYYLRLAAGGAIVLTALLIYALVSPGAAARVRLGRRGA